MFPHRLQGGNQRKEAIAQKERTEVGAWQDNTKTLDCKREVIERYQPHFFARYKSRCNKDKSGINLIYEYFKHNDLINPIYKDKVNEDGSIHHSVFGRVNEGIVLGNYEPETFHIKWNTIITIDMLSKLQTRYKDKLDIYTELLQDMGFNELNVSEHEYIIK